MYNIDIAQIKAAGEYISAQIKDYGIPTKAIILGSGLSNFTQLVTIVKIIKYSEIPFFVTSSIVGHNSQLVLARLPDNSYVLIMDGRLHYYEGYTANQVTFPIMVMQHLGVKDLLVSCAVGGLTSKLKIHDLVIINDHINFTGNNPFIGKNNPNIGPTFLPQSEPYSPKLMQLAHLVAKEHDIVLQEGVYLAVSGPTYETKAEVRAFAMLGADVVGMSTVYEVMMANYFNINVLGIAVVTNLATGLDSISHDHTQVVKASGFVADKFSKLALDIIKRI